MKRLKLFTILLMFALLAGTAGTAAAETANKDLPTQDEVNSFLDSAKTTDAVELSKLALKDHPTWKWDLWKCSQGNVISFYFKCNTAKGYGSIYKGASCTTGLDLVKSHKGDEKQVPEPEVNKTENITENKTQENVTTENITTTGKSTTDLMADINSYTGNTHCASKSCADDFKDYFILKGWKAKTIYAIEVQVVENGKEDVRYVVLN